VSSASRAWTAANWVMIVLFVFSAAVQLNDPDPWLWMPVYLAAAAVAWLETRRRATVVVAMAIALGSVAWAVAIAPRVMGRVRFLDMFGAWEMQNTGIEESREMYGLLIVAVWMAAVGIAAWRRTRRSA
jgi:hypothetical protein